METETELTVEECELLADWLSDEAGTLPFGSKQQALSTLAENYRILAQMKRLLLRHSGRPPSKLTAEKLRVGEQSHSVAASSAVQTNSLRRPTTRIGQSRFCLPNLHSQ